MLLQKPNFQFWHAKHKWPQAVGHVFLAEVLHQIGEALYPEEWTGDEPLVDESPPTPPKPRPPNLKPLRTVTSRDTPAAISAPPSKPIAIYIEERVQRLGLEKVPTTPDEISRYAAVIKRYDYNSDALARLSAVQVHIGSEAVHGRLIFGTRPVVGGPVTPLPSVAWQTERIWPRFYFCQINPAEPYGIAVAGDGFEYLFVTRESLDKTLATIGGKAGGVTTYATGLPGRPSSKQLILEEANNRIRNSSGTTPLPESLAAFARDLRDWLRKEHPSAPLPTARSIENLVRDDWHKRHSTA